MHRTGKKESTKEKKKKSHEKFASRDSNPYPPNRTKNEHLNPLDHLSRSWQFKLKRGIYSFLMVIDSFNYDFFGFHVELNLKLIEIRRKSHNKPITTLSGLVYAAERLRNLWTIDLAATDWTLWPYDSLLARKVSFHRSGKTVTLLFIIISSFRLE